MPQVTVNTPDGENVIGVYIKLRLDCLRTTPEPPSAWGGNFVALVRRGVRIPALRLLIASLRLEDIVPLEGVRVEVARRARGTIQPGPEAPVPADAVLRAGIHPGAVQSLRGLYGAPGAAAAASRPMREFDDGFGDDEELYEETYRRGVQRPVRAPAHLANPVLGPPLIAGHEQAYFGTPPAPMHPAYPDPRMTAYGYPGPGLGRGGGAGPRMAGSRMGMAPPDDFMYDPYSPYRPQRPEPSLESLVAAGADINQVVQLEIVKLLRGMQEPRQRRPFDDVYWDEDPERARTSLAKAASRMEGHQQRIVSCPRAVIDEFKPELMKDMGVTPGMPRVLRDHHRRVPWGKYRTLQRAYVQDLQVLQLLENGQIQQATALLCQCAKSKWQAALHRGDWRVGWEHTALQDPLAKRRWAGTARDMEVSADWLKACDQIEKRALGTLKEQVSDGEDAEPRDGAARPQTAAAKAKAAKAAAKAKAAADKER